MLAIALSLFFSVKSQETRTVMRFKVERCSMTTQRPMRLLLRGRTVADRVVTMHSRSRRVTRGRWRTIAKPKQEVYFLDAERCPKGTIEITNVTCPSEAEHPCTEDLSRVVTTALPFGKEKARR